MENTKYSGLKTEQLLHLTHSAAAPLLSRFSYPWEALEWITPFILELGKSLSEAEYDHPQEDVWISKEAKVAPTAYIHGPAIIGKGTEVRHCAFIRARSGGGKLRGGELYGAEKRHSLRQCAGAPL